MGKPHCAYADITLTLTLITTKLIRGTNTGDSNNKLTEGEVMLTMIVRKLHGQDKMQTKYGKWKEPAYYVIVGNEAKNQVIRVTRFALKKEAKLKLTFEWLEIQKESIFKV